MKASNAQIRKIYGTAKELKIDNELLHTFVFNTTGCKSVAALTKYEAIEVIDRLEQRKSGRKRFFEETPGRASVKQLGLIKHLERELGWDDNPKRIMGFISKYAKVDALHWLTPYQASNIIEGLKKLVEKKKNSQ